MAASDRQRLANQVNSLQQHTRYETGESWRCSKGGAHHWEWKFGEKWQCQRCEEWREMPLATIVDVDWDEG